jgi:hypothetical protein
MNGILSSEEVSDRSYRNGFHAGWNAATVGDEAALKAAMNRVGSKADYLANDTTNEAKLRALLRLCYEELNEIYCFRRIAEADFFTDLREAVTSEVYVLGD